MPYYELYYHFVWATKKREPLLTAVVEPIIYQLIRHKANQLEAVIHAMNGTEDHMHLVATVPPKVAVATFVGQVKGVSSAKFNVKYPEMPRFYWQTEYSAFSFDRKRLPYVVAYVERQKAHHAERTLIPVLERMGEEGGPPRVRDREGGYVTGYEAWVAEMCAWE